MIPYASSTPMLDTLLHRHAYRTGTFTLSSGKTANEYLDVKSALLHPDVIPHIAGAARTAIGGRYPKAVAGVELGGVILAVHLAYCYAVPCLIVRKGERSHGVTADGVDGLENLPPLRDGGAEANRVNVWLIEDVVTTGKSLVAAIERLTQFSHLHLVGVLAVVDREDGGMDVVRQAVDGIGNVRVVSLTTLARIRAAKE